MLINMNDHQTSVKERRQSKRWNLKVPLSVFAADDDEVIGYVLDVSLHGFKLVSERQFGEAQEVVFDIEIPDAQGQWRRARVTALSAYCIEEESGDQYYTGFKFINIEPVSLLDLQRLIDELASFS